MKISLFFTLILFTLNAKAQYAINQDNGFIEIQDQAYFDQMDNISKQLYEEHIGYYNKAVDYYNLNNFENAYFYFNKAFRQSMFSKVKIKVGNDIFQNKAFYTFMSIIRIKKAKSGDVRNAWQLVDDVCDPNRKQVAEEYYKKWKKGKVYW
jgi:Ca2+-binding EF-hand superfamily protein